MYATMSRASEFGSGKKCFKALRTKRKKRKIDRAGRAHYDRNFQCLSKNYEAFLSSEFRARGRECLKGLSGLGGLGGPEGPGGPEDLFGSGGLRGKGSSGAPEAPGPSEGPGGNRGPGGKEGPRGLGGPGAQGRQEGLELVGQVNTVDSINSIT